MAGRQTPKCDCGECARCRKRVYLREWKRRNRDKTAAYARTRRARNPEATREGVRRYQQAHPERKMAHNAVTHALRDGRLTRKPCEVCGAEPAHAHHDDYSKPLDVRWLCITHHAEHHRLAEAA